jgi:hypothetical protein
VARVERSELRGVAGKGVADFAALNPGCSLLLEFSAAALIAAGDAMGRF